MISRGRILRDTNSGKGLISSEGKQYEFSLENNWECDEVPTVGMIVDAEFDEEGKLLAAWAVDQNAIAKEQASLLFNNVSSAIVKYYNNAALLVGKNVLIALSALFLGWFIFDTININIGAKESLGFSFWQVLGFVNDPVSIKNVMAGNQSGASGIFALLCLLSFVGPFLFIFWKHPASHLGNCIALLLIVIVIASSYSQYSDQMDASVKAMGGFGGAQAQKMVEELADQMWKQAMEVVSLGLGAYISLAASFYLAYIGARKYLLASAVGQLPTGNQSSSGGRSGRRLKATQTVTQTDSEVVKKACPSCAIICDETAKFCEDCGAKLV